MTWRLRPARGPRGMCVPYVVATLQGVGTRAAEQALVAARQPGDPRRVRGGRIHACTIAQMCRALNGPQGPVVVDQGYYYRRREKTLAQWLLVEHPAHGRKVVLVHLQAARELARVHTGVPGVFPSHVLLVQGGQLLDNNSRRGLTPAAYNARVSNRLLDYRVPSWWVLDRRRRQGAG